MVNKKAFYFLTLLTISLKGQAVSHKQIALIGGAVAATTVASPVLYRIGRKIRFSSMSYQKRLDYALPFYYKLAVRYLNALGSTSRNEADLQRIVGIGYDNMRSFPGVFKTMWRWIDWMSAYKARDRYKNYPFLYYANALNRDIEWLSYYIKHLMVDAPTEYAKQKQNMRNLHAQLVRLQADIKASYTYKQESTRYLRDQQASQVKKEEARHRRRVENYLSNVGY